MIHANLILPYAFVYISIAGKQCVLNLSWYVMIYLFCREYSLVDDYYYKLCIYSIYDSWGQSFKIPILSKGIIVNVLTTVKHNENNLWAKMIVLVWIKYNLELTIIYVMIIDCIVISIVNIFIYDFYNSILR